MRPPFLHGRESLATVAPDRRAYRVTYRIFGAAIAFLLWLYLVGLVILIGAEVNALLSAAGRRSWAGASAEGTETTQRG